MDYRFFYNERQIPTARLSMDHEAFGLWLSDELGNDKEQLDVILQAIGQLEAGVQREYQWQGRDFLLHLTREDAEVTALTLLQEYSREELEGEDLDFYDSESRAACGLEDFKDLLIEWRDFL